MKTRNYKCLTCEKLLKKKRKYAPKFVWFLTWNSEKEVIKHIKKEHPQIYRKTIKQKSVEK